MNYFSYAYHHQICKRKQVANFRVIVIFHSFHLHWITTYILTIFLKMLYSIEAILLRIAIAIAIDCCFTFFSIVFCSFFIVGKHFRCIHNDHRNNLLYEKNLYLNYTFEWLMNSKGTKKKWAEDKWNENEYSNTYFKYSAMPSLFLFSSFQYSKIITIYWCWCNAFYLVTRFCAMISLIEIALLFISFTTVFLLSLFCSCLIYSWEWVLGMSWLGFHSSVSDRMKERDCYCVCKQVR